MEQIFGQIGEVTNQGDMSEIDVKNLQMPPMEVDVRETVLVHFVMNDFRLMMKIFQTTSSTNL